MRLPLINPCIPNRNHNDVPIHSPQPSLGVKPQPLVWEGLLFNFGPAKYTLIAEAVNFKLKVDFESPQLSECSTRTNLVCTSLRAHACSPLFTNSHSPPPLPLPTRLVCLAWHSFGWGLKCCWTRVRRDPGLLTKLAIRSQQWSRQCPSTPLFRSRSGVYPRP